MVNKSRFFEKTPDGKVVETATILEEQISEGNYDRSGLRQNIDGELFLLNYTQFATLKVVPADELLVSLSKQKVLKVGIFGNNLTQTFDENWDSSQLGYWMPRESSRQSTVEAIKEIGYKLSPAELVKYASDHDCSFIYFYGGEPALYADYLVEVADLLTAKSEIKLILVTNGTISLEVLHYLKQVTSTLVINIHAQSEAFYIKHFKFPLSKIIDNVTQIVNEGFQIEFRSVIIPDENDQPINIKKLLLLLQSLVGKQLNWQIQPFKPTFRIMDKPQLSEAKIAQIQEIALEVGVKSIKILA